MSCAPPFLPGEQIVKHLSTFINIPLDGILTLQAEVTEGFLKPTKLLLPPTETRSFLKLPLWGPELPFPLRYQGTVEETQDQESDLVSTPSFRSLSWSNHLIFLRLCFLPYKMGITIPALRRNRKSTGPGIRKPRFKFQLMLNCDISMDKLSKFTGPRFAHFIRSG